MKLRSSFWLRSILYTLLQRFSLFIFGAISFMILVRGFSQEAFAVWALYLTILTLFEMIKQGLIRNPTIKFLGMPEFSSTKDQVQTASLFINVMFSVISVAAVLIFGGAIASIFKAPSLAPMLWWSVIAIALLIPFNHCEVLLQAHYKFADIFWAYFIRQALFFGAIVVIYFFFPAYFTLMVILGVQIASIACGAAILFAHYLPYRASFHFNKRVVVRIFHFGKYIFGTNLFSNVSRSFDHFITAATLGPSVGKVYVSYYNTVTRINNMIDVPSLAAADVLFPKNVEAFEKDGLSKVKFYFERMVGTILALMVPVSVFIFIFPKLVIFILAGPEYYGAIPILQLTILFGLVRPLSYQFGSTLDALGKPNVNFWANVGFMATNLVLTVLFLRWFGGMGAAYATVVSYTTSLIVMIILLKRYLNLELVNIWNYAFQSYRDVLRLTR